MNARIRWADHLPALALVLAMLAVVWLGWPWPEPLATGFDARGQPVTWAWTPAMPGIALLLWLVWFAFDGLWAAFERQRSVFNPLSLVDEGIVAWLLVGVADQGVGRGMPDTTRAAAWTAGALALAASLALELRRVTAPPPGFDRRAAEDVTGLTREMSTLQAPGRRWSYWAVQAVPHRPLFMALGAAFVLGAATITGGPLWARVLLLVSGLLVLAVCSGGLRTVVTPQRLVLRAGHLGLPLLRLATSEIAEVAVPDFDPLRDFGGWGIRRGLVGDFSGVWAFNVSGSGVLVKTRQGRRYLIGTDHPERLAAVLTAGLASPQPTA